MKDHETGAVARAFDAQEDEYVQSAASHEDLRRSLGMEDAAKSMRAFQEAIGRAAQQSVDNTIALIAEAYRSSVVAFKLSAEINLHHRASTLTVELADGRRLEWWGSANDGVLDLLARVESSLADVR